MRPLRRPGFVYNDDDQRDGTALPAARPPLGEWSVADLMPHVDILPTAWMRDAACVDSQLDFTDDHVNVELADEVCADCAARVQCFLYAVTGFREISGRWAGMSRKALRRAAKNDDVIDLLRLLAS